MAFRVKNLSLGELIFNRRGSFILQILVAIFGIALKLFFRRIETYNANVVPKDKPVIFVHNHPNGLIDPALVYVALPRKISFLAKSTLFKMPVLSFLLKTVEALPLYRQTDAGADISKNQKTFAMCRELLKRGGAIALFPEGVSHDSPKVLPAKTGAARIAIGAVSVGENPMELYIVPVGLFYTSKTKFRSEALLHFGTPFLVEREELDENGQPPKGPVKELTKKIEAAIKEVTVNAETDAELQTAQIAERIFAATDENENLSDRLEFLRKYLGDQDEDDDDRRELRQKLVVYDGKLDNLGIEAEHLSLSQMDKGFVMWRAFVMALPLIILSPFAILGIVIHYIPYKLCDIASKMFTKHGEDDVVSTVKFLAGMVFMPLTWLIVAGVTGYFFGWQTALVSVPVVMLCAASALYTLEEIQELKGWAKAILLFLRKKETFLRLFVERRELLEELKEFD